MTTSKNETMTVVPANHGAIVIFVIYGWLVQSKRQNPDAWYILITFELTETF